MTNISIKIKDSTRKFYFLENIKMYYGDGYETVDIRTLTRPNANIVLTDILVETLESQSPTIDIANLEDYVCC